MSNIKLYRRLDKSKIINIEMRKELTDEWIAQDVEKKYAILTNEIAKA